MRYVSIILLLVILLCNISCTSNTISDYSLDAEIQLLPWEIADYRQFQKTPAWDLAKATFDGDTSIMDEILSRDPSIIDCKSSNGMTLLMTTITNQNRAPFLCQLFLDNIYNFAPNESQQISFRHLLKHGASVNLINKFGETALMIACDYDNIDYVRDLIDSGADINYVQCPDSSNNKDRDNQTALLIACKNNRSDMVKLLIEHGADINFVNCHLESALNFYVRGRDYDMIYYLLNRGVDYSVPTVKVCDLNLQYMGKKKWQEYEHDTTTISLAEALRYDYYPLESKEYQKKMKIVQFLKKRGVDYRKIPIPKGILTEIKNDYPHNWEEYIRNY